MAKFYTFRQNNSGGRFKQNNEVDIKVVIEANNAEHAQDMELYFIGEFDNETGIFVPAGVPELILKGVKNEN